MRTQSTADRVNSTRALYVYLQGFIESIVDKRPPTPQARMRKAQRLRRRARERYERARAQWLRETSLRDRDRADMRTREYGRRVHASVSRHATLDQLDRRR